MAKRVKTNYDRGYVNAMDKIRVFIESSSKVMYSDNIMNCDQCPYKMKHPSWDALPCGQYHCWVELSC